MPVITVLSFTYDCSGKALQSLAEDFVENVKPRAEGLIWKIFVSRPTDRRSAGIYLFRDADAARRYLDGPYVQGLQQSPIVSDVAAETFEVLTDPSVRAGAPL